MVHIALLALSALIYPIARSFLKRHTTILQINNHKHKINNKVDLSWRMLLSNHLPNMFSMLMLKHNNILNIANYELLSIIPNSTYQTSLACPLPHQLFLVALPRTSPRESTQLHANRRGKKSESTRLFGPGHRNVRGGSDYPMWWVRESLHRHAVWWLRENGGKNRGEWAEVLTVFPYNSSTH